MLSKSNGRDDNDGGDDDSDSSDESDDMDINTIINMIGSWRKRSLCFALVHERKLKFRSKFRSHGFREQHGGKQLVRSDRLWWARLERHRWLARWERHRQPKLAKLE